MIKAKLKISFLSLILIHAFLSCSPVFTDEELESYLAVNEKNIDELHQKEMDAIRAKIVKINYYSPAIDKETAFELYTTCIKLQDKLDQVDTLTNTMVQEILEYEIKLEQILDPNYVDAAKKDKGLPFTNNNSPSLKKKALRHSFFQKTNKSLQQIINNSYHKTGFLVYFPIIKKQGGIIEIDLVQDIPFYMLSLINDSPADPNGTISKYPKMFPIKITYWNQSGHIVTAYINESVKEITHNLQYYLSFRN